MRIILIGGDETVYHLTRQLHRRKHHITIINREAERCRDLARHTEATIVLGEGSNPGTLEEAGARAADVIIALTPHDQDNLIACQIAQRNFGVPRSIAVVNDPENEEVFHKLGITVALSSTRIIASLIEQQAGFEDITELMSIAEGRINVSNIRLDEKSPVVGKKLKEIDLQGSLVGAIIRGGEFIVPHGLSRLLANDELLVISDADSQEHDMRVLTGNSGA